MENIRIGTLVDGNQAVCLLPRLMHCGFESFALTFWQTTGGVDLPELAKYNGFIIDKPRCE